MTRYYDHESISCQGCFYYQPGAYPNGEPYMACRWYGYILEPSKGVSPEPCAERVTPEEGARREAYRKEQETKKRRRR